MEYRTKHGVTIRLDPRFAVLAAALTASSNPVSHEHLLVTDTRQHLLKLREHPSVKWLAEMDQKYIILGLCMQTAQIGFPPAFTPHGQERIPEFIKEEFSNPPHNEMSKHLGNIFHASEFEKLIEKQHAMWHEVINDIMTIIEDVDLIAFQKMFYGKFPYQPVVIPLANLAPSRIDGVGTANDKETFAICFLSDKLTYKEYKAWEILELIQHEASHPIIDKIWRTNQQVPLMCGNFVEEKYPSNTRFTQIYPDVTSRFVESLIQTSSWFFIRETLGESEADEFLQEVTQRTGYSMKLYIEALKPWWDNRCAGKASGFDQVFHKLPGWLREIQYS